MTPLSNPPAHQASTHRRERERLQAKLDDLENEVTHLRNVLGIIAVGHCSHCELKTTPERDCIHNLARWTLRTEDGNPTP